LRYRTSTSLPGKELPNETNKVQASQETKTISGSEGSVSESASKEKVAPGKDSPRATNLPTGKTDGRDWSKSETKIYESAGKQTSI
jgi:hypothetical protein